MEKKTVFALILITILSCNQKEVDTKTEGKKLMQVSREWSQSASSRDLEKTLSYWADDALVISAGQPNLKGKEAIRQMVEGGYKNPSFNISWEPQSAEISKSGDLGYLIEDTQITVNDSTGKPVIQKFKSVTI
jgi:uncharacterized protein (TIGR02246 family)